MNLDVYRQIGIERFPPTDPHRSQSFFTIELYPLDAFINIWEQVEGRMVAIIKMDMT